MTDSPAGRRSAAVSGLVVLVLVAVFTACGGEPPPLPPASAADVVSPLPAGSDGTVDRVVDGDTVVVDGRTVRLIGIDTPETVKQDAPVGCYGPEASRATHALLPEGERVRLVPDREDVDRFGRDLRYVYRLDDAVFVQAYLVRNGFARTLTIEPNTSRRDALGALQRDAQSSARGLWGAC